MSGYEIIQIIAGAIIFLTFWGWIPADVWWVRAVDFPRIQLLSIGGVCWLILCCDMPYRHFGQWLLMLLLSLALIYQLRMILPYTRLWKKQVRKAGPTAGMPHLSIMVSNVLTTNQNTRALIELINIHQPDVLLTLESDLKWERALQVIEPAYPYSVKVPLDNLYGMHLYARLPLHDAQVKYLLVDDIPSIHARLELPNGAEIFLYCLHPMPPSPTEAYKSTTRDGELLLVGRHIKAQGKPAILTGDLNDVAWSKTTRLFQQISGLLDPRVGRHFINTFHVKYPFLRWALDHLFHSPCFTLVKMQRLPSIGSDHFPVLTVLQYESDHNVIAAQKDEALTADKQDKAVMQEKIAAGKTEGEKLSAQKDSDNH